MVLVDDPGAHRGDREAATVATASGRGEQFLRALERALDRLGGAVAGIGLEAVGLEQAAIERRRGERYFRASEVDSKHEVALKGHDISLGRHSGGIHDDR